MIEMPICNHCQTPIVDDDPVRHRGELVHPDCYAELRGTGGRLTPSKVGLITLLAGMTLLVLAGLCWRAVQAVIA